jgi:hypothetical protein
VTDIDYARIIRDIEHAQSPELVALTTEILRLAEHREDCDYCRGHIRSLRLLSEDLAVIARLGEEMRTDPAARKWLVRAGRVGEEMGILAFLARVVHRVRGLG